ncbi:MAG: hypothetical protein V3T84_13110 [Phycisphaerales bacterium]
MTLTQESQKSPIIYRGPGEIHQTPGASLAFTLYSTGTQRFPGISETLPNAPGQLVGPEYYYTLRGTDLQGNVWLASRVIPDISCAAETHGEIVSGNLWQITSDQRSDFPFGRPRLRAIYVRHPDVPFNRSTRRNIQWAGQTVGKSLSLDYVRLQRLNCIFRVATDFDGKALVASVEALKGPLPTQLVHRITDGLRFTTSSLFRERIVVIQDRGDKRIQITSDAEQKLEPKLCPPLDPVHARVASTDFWTMFSAYMGFYHKCAARNVLSPALEMHGILQGSCGSVETHALTLAVGVEALVAQLHPKLGSPNKQEEREMMELTTYLQEWDGDEGLKERMLGSLQRFRSPSTNVRLRGLLRKGVIEKVHYDAWQSLRHPAAHGVRKRQEPSQETLNLIQTVTTLLYRLIFHTIKYRGTFTDRSTAGWQTATYGDSEKKKEQST